MIIGILREDAENETRVSLTPASVKKLKDWGDVVVLMETDAGKAAGYSDQAYLEEGAEVLSDRAAILARAKLFLRVNRPSEGMVRGLAKGAILVSQLDPYRERPLIEALAGGEISSVSVEMIPRTTRAQKMDVLSSQASLAGYAAVIKAAERSHKIFPMMMTPAGTISPSKVFVIGAGVAGLQAIATAKRLGASVTAFDTRPVVEEQVHSLGAKFLKIDLGETGQTQGGYAKSLTKEQLARQREAMAKQCLPSDVVITTAKLFGKPAPRLITKDIVGKMRRGSLLIDLAVETGGNVEGSEPDRIVDHNGVAIVGYVSIERHVPHHASQMYSSNMVAFLEEFWDKDKGEIDLSRDDEILESCLITHKGKIVNRTVAAAQEK